MVQNGSVFAKAKGKDRKIKLDVTSDLDTESIFPGMVNSATDLFTCYELYLYISSLIFCNYLQRTICVELKVHLQLLF